MLSDIFKVQESQTSRCSPVKSQTAAPAEPAFLDLLLVTEPLGNSTGVSLYIRLYVSKAKSYHRPKPFLFLIVPDSNKATPPCEPMGAIFTKTHLVIQNCCLACVRPRVQPSGAQSRRRILIHSRLSHSIPRFSKMETHHLKITF